jgi:ADP-ribosylglycohydrolase
MSFSQAGVAQTIAGIGWGARNFHGGNGRGPPKRAGENTDYGDYNILVLEHLADTASEPRAFELREFIPRWQKRMTTWRAWMCTQTKQALQKVASGVPPSELGGNSNAMSIRSAGMFGYFGSENEVVAAAKTAMFTHQEQSAHLGNEFFTRVTWRVIHKGLEPREAIEQVAAESRSSFIKEKVKQALAKVDEALNPSSGLVSEGEFVDDKAITSMARLWDVGKTEPIKVGKASPTEGTLPAAIYFICRYNDLAAAASANAEVGGDNASRAVAIGMVLGAYQGLGGVPRKLGQGALVEWDSTMALLGKMPLLQEAVNEL